MNYGTPEESPFADAEMSPADKAPDKEAKDNPEGNTAMLPKSILAGKDFKPGEEVVLKIVKLYPDQVEVAYSYGDEGGDKEEGPGEYEEPKQDEVSSMME